MTDLPRYLQLLWEREPTGRRGPKPGHTIEQIGAAAAAIADGHGLAAVSMKRVAGAIGLTTMSLYRYVDSKAELDAVMLDSAYGEPDMQFAATDDWRERIEAWARRVTDLRLVHPWMVSVNAPQGPPLTPNAIAWMEAGLAALEDTPLNAQQRLSVLLAVDGWALNHVRQSLQLGLTGQVDPDSPQAQYLAHLELLIDPKRLPHLASAAPEVLAADDGSDFFEEEWRFGIDLLIGGIERLVERRSVVTT